MVKSSVCFTRWVAGQAGRIFINIARNGCVPIVRFGIDMANGATVHGVIVRVGVALRATVPNALVLAAVNRKMLPVVSQVLRWLPVEVGGVALCAVGGEICLDVVRALRSIEIGLVASGTIVRCVRKIAARMASRTVAHFVALREWEKGVVNLVRSPIWRGEVVAFEAVGREACLRVVGVCRCVEICEVAVHAKVAVPTKLHGRFGDVALGATHHAVYAREREAVVEVDLLHVVHQPVVGVVAAGAVVARRLLVDVEVASIAVGLGVFKDQFIVAVSAVHAGVAAREREIRFVVVEFAGINGQEQPRSL